MNWPGLLKRKHYYMVMFALISIAFVSFSAIIYNHYQRISRLGQDTAAQFEVIRQSRVVMMDLVDMETTVRTFLVSGDEDVLASYRATRNLLNNDISTLRQQIIRNKIAASELHGWLDRIRAFRKSLDDQIEYKINNPQVRVRPATLEKQQREMAIVRLMIETTTGKWLVDTRAQALRAQAESSNFLYTVVLGNVVIIGILLMGTLTIINLEVQYQKSVEAGEQAQKRYREVIEGINDGVFEYNFVNEDFYCSPAYRAMLGYGPDEIENRAEAFWSLIHPEDREGFDASLRHYLESNDLLYSHSFRMRHKDGGYRWVLSRGIGLGDDFSAKKSLIGTHADITEQKLREEELKQLYGDLETFTYITSHDLRSPLVNLKGFSKELELSLKSVTGVIAQYEAQMTPDDITTLKAALDTDIPEALGFIGKGVDRMDSLTKAILDLSRIGKRVFTQEPVEAQAIFDKCVGALGYDITQKQIEVSCPQPLPVLITDAVALEQIFGNLLDNAVKYLRPEARGRIEMTVRDTGNDYIFTLADNGRGIEDADKSKIFEIFRRARNTGEVAGLGLGMAYVKATLRRLSGGIWFESQVNKGTRFHVRLPKRAEVSDTAAIRPTKRVEA